ncbi:CARDB domain-containing protein [Deltaproteobacteria bacterium IMCC39524]|nr:CARDB domain-containing protein [Deltaproteobacteria bacterium IMCC39524]
MKNLLLLVLLLLVWTGSANAVDRAYYPFSGDANDASINGNHGTVNGATLTVDRNSFADNAYSFDGTNSISVPNDASLNFLSGESFKVSAWVKTSSTGEIQSIFTKQDTDKAYSLRITAGGKAQFFLQDAIANSIDVVSASVVSDDSWHLIEGVRNATDGTISISVDNVVENSKINTLTGDYDPTDVAGIGYSGFGDAWKFNGSIDEIRIEDVVFVSDTTPPVITLNGSDPVDAEAGTSYTDAGATANDDVYGSVAVTVGGDVVDINSLGTYVITYDAADTLGNDATQVTRTVYVVDTIPPETSIDSGAEPTPYVTDITFTFSANDSFSDDAAATFECRIDGGIYSTCTSPQSYNGLAAGSYTFEVRAADPSLNVDPTPASFAFMIYDLTVSDDQAGSIAANYQDDLVVTASGAVPGSTIFFEQLVDVAPGGIGGEDMVVRTVQAVANGSGVATVTLNYHNTLDRFHAFGDYSFRATDITVGAGTGTDSSVFSVSQVGQPDNLSGLLYESDGSTLVTGAFLRFEDKWGNIYGYALTNSSGFYVFDAAAAGDYLVYPMAYGYAANVPAPITISGPAGSYNINLASDVDAINGQVHSSGSGIDGVEIIANCSGVYSVGLTDLNGNYSLAVPAICFDPVLAGHVELAGHDDFSPSLKGYVDDGAARQLSACVGAVDFDLPAATATISGQVLASAVPTGGIPVVATNGSGERAYGVSDVSGNYSLNVSSAADWNVMPKQRIVNPLGFVGNKIAVDTSGGDQVGQNFNLNVIDGWVEGVVTDAVTTNPLAGIEVYSSAVAYSSVKTDADGFYRVPVVQAEGLPIHVDVTGVVYVDPVIANIAASEFLANVATVDFVLDQIDHYDLVVDSVTGVPATAEAGDLMTVTVTISNVGNIKVPLDNYVAIYISTDCQVTSDDILLDYIRLTTMQPGEAETADFTFLVPSWVMLGETYYIGVNADLGNRASNEHDETNNFTGGQGFLVSGIPYDLVAGSVTGVPANANAGDSLSITATVSNVGPNRAPKDVYASLYISTDAVITTDDTELSYTRVKTMEVGDVTVALNAVVPSWVQSGVTYYLGFIADASNRLAESNEVNNASPGQAFVVSGTPYDLVAGSVTGVPANANAGDSLSVTATVSNVGTSRAPRDIYATLYLSTDAVITADDTKLKHVRVSTMMPGDVTVAFNGKVPSWVQSGVTYYLGFIADSSNWLVEPNEADNISAAYSFDVP